jgi:hypothetical protein
MPASIAGLHRHARNPPIEDEQGDIIAPKSVPELW